MKDKSNKNTELCIKAEKREFIIHQNAIAKSL